MKKKVFYIIVPIIIIVVGFNFFKSEKPSGSTNSSESCILNAKEYVEADKNNAQILDVRTQREYDSGHLEGAILMDINQSNFKELVNKLDKEKTYYVYCKTGIRSRSAVNYMMQVGFKKVCDLEGGTNNLSRAGIPLVQ